MAYLCLGIGPTKKQQAFIYVKIHILRVHFLGTSLPTDFRTRGLFSAFCTEVFIPVPLLTSVPEACFPHFVRKFHTLFACSKRFMTQKKDPLLGGPFAWS